MVMDAQAGCPTSPHAGPFKCLHNGMNSSGPSINGLSINVSEFGDTSNHHNTNNYSNPYSSSVCISSASAPYSTPPSPSIGQLCHSPRPMQSPVFFQTTTPPVEVNNVPYCPSLHTPRSPILPAAIVSYSQASPHHVYSSQTTPHHLYTSQHNMMASHHCPSAGQGWYPSNTIIINPAGATPGHGVAGGRITPAGCASPGRVTPGRITPGWVTPVHNMATKKRYIDIMLASTASTVAIDNKIEQAMDLVKSHLMFAVREEVDVLKERIGELMERINHLEYENTVLRKYATQEALQQIQQQHGGAPNP